MICPECKEVELIGCPVNAKRTGYYCFICNKDFKIEDLKENI